MKLIPEVKNKIVGEKNEIKGYDFVLPKECDERIIKAASKAPKGNTIVNINIGAENSDGYQIIFGKKITVNAKGTKGAFYAIQTLRQIAKNGF